MRVFSCLDGRVSLKPLGSLLWGCFRRSRRRSRCSLSVLAQE